MTIISQEVKTITRIALSTSDLGKAIEAYKADVANIIFPEAFKFMDIDDMSIGNLHNNLKNIGVKGNKQTYDYIARHFGFDGVENIGYYNETTDKYRMVVWTYGNNIVTL